MCIHNTDFLKLTYMIQTKAPFSLSLLIIQYSKDFELMGSILLIKDKIQHRFTNCIQQNFLVLNSKKRFGAVTEKISDGSTGNVAIDFYHKYKVKPNTNNLLSLVSGLVFILMVTKSLSFSKRTSELMLQEDIKLLKFIGMDAMRFSISWSRVLPSKRSSLWNNFSSSI